MDQGVWHDARVERSSCNCLRSFVLAVQNESRAGVAQGWQVGKIPELDSAEYWDFKNFHGIYPYDVHPSIQYSEIIDPCVN